MSSCFSTVLFGDRMLRPHCSIICKIFSKKSTIVIESAIKIHNEQHGIPMLHVINECSTNYPSFFKYSLLEIKFTKKNKPDIHFSLKTTTIFIKCPTNDSIFDSLWTKKMFFVGTSYTSALMSLDCRCELSHGKLWIFLIVTQFHRESWMTINR